MNKKLIIIVAALALLIGLHFSGLTNMFSFETFQHSKELLQSYVITHYLLSVLAYSAVYITFTVFAIPSPTVLTVIGGFLFGIVPALLIVLLSATIGAICAFLFARYVAGQTLQKRYASNLTTFNKKLKEDGTWYLLSIRLIPFFPFSLFNLLAGLTKVDLFTFSWTTALGIIPGSFLLVYAGHHLEHVKSISDIFPKEIIIALILLSILGLTPIILKRFRKK